MNQLDNNLLTSHNYFSVVQLLRQQSRKQPNADAFIFLEDGENQETKVTYQELDLHSRRIAAYLQRMGLTGERALLLYPSGLDYLAAFFGCLYAGVIAVPAYPPQNQRNTPRIQAIVADSQAAISAQPRREAIALTTKTLVPKMESWLGNLKWLATDDLVTKIEAHWQELDLDRDTIAFLQYTSGSTGTPKGVMVSHGNLLHNAAMTYRWMGHSPKSKFVSWLPIYHDMGLIGGILQPLYGGFPCVLMSPTSFLQRPYRWLQAISKYQGTTSGAPNFAYELCLRKISSEQRSCLDLSSWQVAFNGAEPIRHETLKEFAATFAECGFREEAFYPCYGMAEATLLVAGRRQGEKEKRGNLSKAIDKLALAENRIVEVFEENRNSKTLVGCGTSIPGQKIVIVNPDTLTLCENNCVGEIWVTGDSVAKGYWNRLEETEEVFHAKTHRCKEEADFLRNNDTSIEQHHFLRTGDLGFLDDSGELFVTGRLKDLIIIRGRNLYPQDIELTAQRSHDALRLDSNAAFTVEIDNDEKLLIVQELEFRAKPNLEEVITAIRQTVTETHEIEVYGVVLIKPGSIPKTSSGKIQRRTTRNKFLEGRLDTVASSVLETQEWVDAENNLIKKELLQLSPQELLTQYLQSKVAQVLKRLPQDINLDHSLTSLGLDSLKVFELKNQIEADLEVTIAIANLFSGCTTRSLSNKILAQLKTNSSKGSSSLQRVTTSNNIHPVSFAQARLWFLDRLKSGNPAYNISFAVQIEGKLEVQALENSLNQVIARHEILRTSFATSEGKPVQVIHPALTVTLSVVDGEKFDCFPSESIGQKDIDLNLITTQEHQQPFDLTQIPLLRLKLLRLASEKHLLLLTMHHIIADGLSAEVFMTEVAQHYQRLSVPELPIQYKDFVYWQQQSFQEQKLIDYWKQKLKDAPPLLQLPTDRPRPPVQSYQGKSQAWELPASLTQQLQNLAQQEKVTLFMLLLAGFKTLLYRYTGQEDLLVGSPIANRNHEKLKELIGFFVNTLVLRSNLAGNPSFLDLLSQIRQVALEAYAHQDLPFDKLVEVLQPERDLSYTPLFQVMFAWQNAPQLPTIPDLTFSEFKVDPRIAQFDLSVSIENTAEKLIATFEYNTDLFDDATINRMISHYQNLLTGIVVHPQAKLSDIPLLSNQERQQLLIDWNPTLVDYSQDVSIQQLFETQVKQNPDAVAVVFGNQKLTYQQLNNQANQLAHYLQEIGVKPEVLVGVYLECSLKVFIAILGIIKAGGVYLPLDPEYPTERIAWMLQDASPAVILSQEYLRKKIPTRSAKVICLDSEWNNISQKSSENLEIRITSENAVYTIYTSGSTGKPKGVVCTYGGLVNTYLAWQKANLLPDSNNSCFLQMASFSFDVFTGDLIKALCSGAKLVICPKELLLEPKKLYQLMLQEKVNCADFVPAVLMNLVNYLEQTKQSLDFIKLLIVGSDSWYVQDYQRVKKLCGLNTKLINAYGVSEATIDSTYFEAKQLNLSSDRIVSIGRPFPNTLVYLLDHNLQPVPIGVWGEIYLGGVSLARGYLNNSELTKKKFIPNPFTVTSRDVPWNVCTPVISISSSAPLHPCILTPILYKTGDKARYLPDGNIEFLERVDNQIKIRGFRIEITEIEAFINKYQDIKQAVVIVDNQDSNNKTLVAYLVLQQPETDKLTEELIQKLRTYLKEHLPDYMIPTKWQLLKELPLTVNGKTDRKFLKTIKIEDNLQITSTTNLPRNQQEQIIAEIWQEILQRENIDVNDNFFDVGGHSLLLAQVQEKLESSFQINLTITDLFKYPSISSLANYLNQRENNSFTITNRNNSEQFINRIDKQKNALARRKQVRRKSK
ncbi:amino acid adenylation domain protein [Stanieria cyanosphaera PCC 7437]|uniref:Amino acid adenylation domain protein n=1 Tax=Stanieria cyanosphaera (strain ATCC 29371 / PCC 7437) TaxID=111780 RepID=K9XUC2_STAC7|nr:non-ribosomal peptide synthetase [Stanieria cyanosphaera]AFZ36200.1 amino acid adenylation domain protein [Stanieria cyanosphaera PCC 7437]